MFVWSIGEAMSDLIEQMRRHVASYRTLTKHRQACLDMCDEIERLTALVKMGEEVVMDFMPNIGKCALQDYGRLNEFLMAAAKATGGDK
jgi:hypothetical protein